MIKRLPLPPWRHESELAMVRDWFYSQHAKSDAFSAPPGDMRQRAVDRVNLWLFKAGQLPPAVLATANLTEALIHDDEVRKRKRKPGPEQAQGQAQAQAQAQATMGVSVQALQSIYAMAFARFVNAFVDRDVARSHAADLTVLDSDDGEDISTMLTTNTGGATPTGRGESSMYAHAATIGMPDVFVDLRHQVTHGDIPSLVYLRRMTVNALEWLWERWWVKNATGDPTRALWELAERRQIALEAQTARRYGQESMSLDNSVSVSPQPDHGL
jgi:ribosomal biogenesis protein LAS1